MNIVYYSPHPHLSLQSPAGYGTHMREMIHAFESAGHTVHPVVMGGMGTEAVEMAVSSGRTKSVLKKLTPAVVWESMKDYLLLSKDNDFEQQLENTLHRLQPDLVYERASCLQLSGVRAAARAGIPHIMEMNAPYVEERKVHFSISSLFEHRASQVEKMQVTESSRVIVVSEALKQYLVDKHDLPEKAFFVLPNAVNPEKVRSNKQHADKIRSLYNLQDKIVVGFVGSLFKWHGVDRLLRAVNKLKSEGYPVALLVVGSGSILPELKALTASLEIEDEVVFTGNIPHANVFDYIEAMDVTVMAHSNWYGSPIKIFEYGAIGKPIVAPNNGPVREVIRHEVDGLLTDDEEDLVQHLRRLIENPVLRQELAESFNRKVMQEHTWARNAEKVLEVVGVLTPSFS